MQPACLSGPKKSKALKNELGADAAPARCESRGPPRVEDSHGRPRGGQSHAHRVVEPFGASRTESAGRASRSLRRRVAIPALSLGALQEPASWAPCAPQRFRRAWRPLYPHKPAYRSSIGCSFLWVRPCGCSLRPAPATVPAPPQGKRDGPSFPGASRRTGSDTGSG